MGLETRFDTVEVQPEIGKFGSICIEISIANFAAQLVMQVC